MKPEQIIDAVCEESGMPAQAIAGGRREERFFNTRLAIAYICRVNCIPWTVVAEHFPHNSTVALSSRYRRAMEVLDDPDLKHLIDRSLSRLQGRKPPEPIKSPVKIRKCLMHGGEFTSRHVGERICTTCKENDQRLRAGQFAA